MRAKKLLHFIESVENKNSDVVVFAMKEVIQYFLKRMTTGGCRVYNKDEMNTITALHSLNLTGKEYSLSQLKKICFAYSKQLKKNFNNSGKLRQAGYGQFVWNTETETDYTIFSEENKIKQRLEVMTFIINPKYNTKTQIQTVEVSISLSYWLKVFFIQILTNKPVDQDSVNFEITKLLSEIKNQIDVAVKALRLVELKE